MTDTSQRIRRKLVTCLVALHRRTNLGLMLGVDGLAVAACLVLAAPVSGQTVVELALTVLAVTGGPAALAAIYGVGEAGAQFARAMGNGGKLRPVCFFDEERAFTRRSVASLEMFPVSVLRLQVARHRIASIGIALPRGSPLRMRALTRKRV